MDCLVLVNYISPECSLEGLMLKLQYFGHLMQRTDSFEKTPWCWERLKVDGEGDDRGWDGWMASLTQWTWVWASSRSWWWTGKPDVLQSMGSHRVGLDWSNLAAVKCKVTLSLSIVPARSLQPLQWKDWCSSCNSNTVATWCKERTHLKRPWCWERLKAGGWDDWMASQTRWTWVRVNSGRWWRTRKPGIL